MSKLSTGATAEDYSILEIGTLDKEACLDWLLAYALGNTDYNDLLSVLVREEAAELAQIREMALFVAQAGHGIHTMKVQAACARYAELSLRADVRAALLGEQVPA